MKNNASTAIAVIALLISLAALYFIHHKKVSRLERQLSIENIKNDFIIKECNCQSSPYDSIYAKNDTVSFYKNGTFRGKTIIVTQ